MSEIIIKFVSSEIQDWENGLSPFFGDWNEYASMYEMKFTDKDPRPLGISKNVSAETPRAVNTLATSITRMQTTDDPPFELRSDSVPEEKLFQMEKKIRKNLKNFQFKRNLLKGNRGLCLFGTQIWETPYRTISMGANNLYSGTAFKGVSLLQMAFDPSVYDIEDSDHMSKVMEISDYRLLNLAESQQKIWNMAEIEKAIDEKKGSSDQGTASFAQREARRARAGYSNIERKKHELILYNGRVNKEIIEEPRFAEMWEKYGRTDDPRLSDITIGILDRKYLVRLHPTPYGTWQHLYKIGHYIEIELESLGYGVGPMGKNLQKDMNRTLRYVSNVAKFSLFNMFLAGHGSGLKSGAMNVIPWSALSVGDISQIKELRPQVEGISAGLKLYEILRDDFRGVTHATTTLQAALSGATATESSLAQNEALRAISITAEVNSESVIWPYFQTTVTNLVDQNPYDTDLFHDVDIEAKVTTDKDYRPEHARKLLEFANLLSSIRNNSPLDLNPAPIYEYLARAVGINPRRLKEPRNQVDRLLDVLKRVRGSGMPMNELLGEAAGAGEGAGNFTDTNGSVPNSPLNVSGVV